MMRKKEMSTRVVKEKTMKNQEEAVMVLMQMSQPQVKKMMIQMKKVITKKIVMKMMRLIVKSTMHKTLSPWKNMLEEMKILKVKMT